MARPRKVAPTEPEAQVGKTEDINSPKPSDSSKELAAALLQAIHAAQPITKRTQFNKPSKTPWMPKDGSAKPRLKRRVYHHGLLLGDPTEPNNRLLPAEVELFNKLKPGSYCNGYVKVVRRRDKGIDIDYPIRTSSQRLRLSNEFGIRTFLELLQRCVAEASAPKPLEIEDDE